MARLIDAAEQRQRDGIAKALTHVHRMYTQGLESFENLEKARMFALTHHFKTMDVETYKTARENGDWDKFEQLQNDPRSGTQAEQEAVMRRAAAHYLTDVHLSTQYQDVQDLEKQAKVYHKEISKFIDTSEFDADSDIAIAEANAKLSLGDKVSKPVEVPSWSLPVQTIDPDSNHARDFKLRNENTRGTKEYHDAYDVNGEKRDSRGRYIPKDVLREAADKIPTRKNSTFEEDVKRAKSEYDDTLGYTVDKEYGVRTAEEARDIEAYEQGQRNDAAAAAEATPAPPSDPGPVILPNPSEA
jgi:hypothetical protein